MRGKLKIVNEKQKEDPKTPLKIELPFEETLADLLKIKPPPDRKPTGASPIAVIVRETQNQYVVRCPFCYREHFHGNVSLGTRVSHCVDRKPREYELKKAEKGKKKISRKA